MPLEHPDLPSTPDLETVCAEARRLREAADRSVEVLRSTRRELADAARLLELASREADRHAIADEKSALARRWREAVAEAPDVAARQEATATWMRSISDLNGRTRLAMAQLTTGRHRVAALEAQVGSIDLQAATTRIRAETAEALCTEARNRRAAEEERLAAAEGHGTAIVGVVQMSDGGARPVEQRPDGEPSAEPVVATGRPLAESETVRRLLAGDQAVHRALAGELGEMSGILPARYLLLLDTLVEELIAAAMDAGELSFDHDHPLWGQFSRGEARQIMRGLRDLGFRLDLEDGWYGGRAPTASDLAAAMGFAGYDLRSLRAIPSPAELRELPRSVLVAAHDHLRRTAPDLTLDQMNRLLAARADGLSELWNEWGRVRALLAGGLPAAA